MTPRLQSFNGGTRDGTGIKPNLALWGTKSTPEGTSMDLVSAAFRGRRIFPTSCKSFQSCPKGSSNIQANTNL